MTDVLHFFEYVAYAFAAKKLRSATIESLLSGMKFFHRLSRGFELDTTHTVIASALKGTEFSHAEVGYQATVRRPVSWAMFLAGESIIPAGRNGGRVLSLSLCVSFCFLIGASEIFPETGSRIHEMYRLQRVVDVALFRGRVQLGVAQWLTADRVKVRFRGSKGAQLRKKGRLFRTFGRVHRGPWGAVAALSIFLTDVRADEYALHSLRIGAATHLSAGGPPQRRCSERAGGRQMRIRRTFGATGRMPAG